MLLGVFHVGFYEVQGSLSTLTLSPKQEQQSSFELESPKP